jgi:p-hydroxybenzoate 3-monooxygenase
MTSMLHRFSDATHFDLGRKMAELQLVNSSTTAAKNLAENYAGLPFA